MADERGALVRVGAVRKGWYGTEPHLHKLYDPEKMKPEERVFYCYESDISDSEKSIHSKEIVAKHPELKNKKGWMKRLDDNAEFLKFLGKAPPEGPAKPKPEPVQVATESAPAVQEKRGPGRPPKRAADQE